MTRWLWCLLMLALIGCDDGEGSTPATAMDMAAVAPDDPDAGPADPDAGPAETDAGPDAAPPPAPFEDPGPVIDPETAMGYVDPFIGSGGTGFGYAALTPAAQMPLGMMRLGPDTTNAGNHVTSHHFSGYHHPDPDVRGFSHVRLVGTGVADLGLLRVLPQRSLDGPAPSARWAPMDKASEAAAPGRYGVRLTDPAVSVELTASQHAGVHRYRFEDDGRVYLIVDAGASITGAAANGAGVSWDGEALRAHVDWSGGFTGRSQGFVLSARMRIEPPPAAVFGWDGEAFVEGAQAEGPQAALALAFDDVADVPVELRVGISYIDDAQAAANLEAQIGERGFDEVAAAAHDAWREKIGRVRVAGGSERERRIFYSAQYHAYAMPTRFSEQDGRYRGLDGEVHHPDEHGGGFTYYTDLSLWDSFRTLHPWLVLTDPDVQRDCLRSLMAMYADGGSMPRWPANTSYSGSMIGSSADMLFAGSAAKGIEGVDYDAAFDALLRAASGPVPRAGRSGIEDYLELGYVAADGRSGSVSRTLEFAYSDHMLAGLGERLGRPEAEVLRMRGQNYRNLFDAESGFFFPRMRDGSMQAVAPEGISMGEGPYVEGNAWHWRFSAFHDPDGLAGLFGGAAGLGDALDRFFDLSRLGTPGFTPTIPDLYYWHGNEPQIHAAFLYHATDRPERVAEQVRRIQNGAYADAPAGLVGNDDGGTLSAWYLFAAMGLYPVAGSDLYYTASPLFPRMEIDHGDGTLTVEAWGADAEVHRFDGLWLDDAPVEDGRLRHADLIGAGTLRFEMVR